MAAKRRVFIIYKLWRDKNLKKKNCHFGAMWQNVVGRNIYVNGAGSGKVKIMPALLTNQMTGIFRWGIYII